MGNLFKPKIESSPAAAAPEPPPPPKPVRMPTQTDPSVAAAAQRTRSNIMRRKGRLSTILTDQTAGVGGTGSQKLGG